MLTLLKNDFLDSLWSHHDSNTQTSTWVCNWTQRVYSTSTYTWQSSSIGGCLRHKFFSYRHKIKRVSSCSMNIQYHQVVEALCVIVLLKKVLIWWREENDLSPVALVMEKVRFARSRLSTSLSMHLTVLLWLRVSAMVLTCGTFFTWMAESAKAVLVASGSTSSCILKRPRSIFSWKYSATAFGIICTSLPLAASISCDSTS